MRLAAIKSMLNSYKHIDVYSYPDMSKVFDIRKSSYLFYIFIAIFWSFYVFLLLKTPFHWWFEDDPVVYSYVAPIKNPIEFFTNIKSFSATFTPLQFISFWIDYKLAPRSTFIAYLHQGISCLLVIQILFYVLSKFLRNNLYAFILTLLWMILPSTIVINEFIGTRHYMEGLLFSLIAIMFAQMLVSSDRNESFIIMSGICIAAFISALYKEIFASTSLFFLFCYLGYYKKYRSAIAIVLIGCIYFIWRTYIFGTNLHYTMPFPGAYDTLLWLSKIPFIMTGNPGGYLVCLLIVFCGSLLIFKRIVKWYIILFLLILIITALMSTFPAAYAMFYSYNKHGTWYRVPFYLNSLLLLTGGYLFFKTRMKILYIPVILITILFLLSGATTTIKKWNSSKSRYRLEGVYYLENPNRLIYSELPAHWYLKGIHDLYSVANRHYITSRQEESNVREVLLRHDTIWRYNGRDFVEDKVLFKELLDKQK